MKIANIEFPQNPVFLAPMEDVTNPAFRMLCKRFGADMVYTEFISCDALIRDIPRTLQKLTINEAERPVAIQIYGREPEPMAEAARMAESAHPDIIDINFGCPVKKVAGKGAGAGLLRDIPKMLEITRAVVKAVNTPVTVKTRLGWDEENKIIVDLAERLQDCGIQALAIHGRTRSQMYKGEADWTLIGEVKNNQRMHIPIIGNGDVTTPERARECFDRYGVDAIMVGRASIGCPWIFQEIKSYLNGTETTPLTFEEKEEIIKGHVQSTIDWLDERRGILHVRRHLAATPIFKGIPNFKDTRIAMLRAETKEELFSIIDGVKL
ncbi:MAG: tRNA dihydrouridine synthase DusB [Paludibacteraceae bacterium]|nr:tRNA dihydrouridine synthase DusB [Paludibacteraceae bacterium]